MIQGYPNRASVTAGGSVVLHVSTDAPRFRVRFYRWGDGFAPVQVSSWRVGALVAPGSAVCDWRWPAYDFSIPDDWPSAVYIAQLQEWDTAARGPRFNGAAVLFVVRGAGRERLLYKIPLATYHAYNTTGGACLHANAPRSQNPPGGKVTLRRPGGGIGGTVWGPTDYYDARSPRQTFAHWDAPFTRWLVRNGYDLEFCTDLDIHHDPYLCRCYRLIVSAGQDEYWSAATRERVEAFVASGGNAAFFGAKVCWRRVHMVEHGTAIVCHQGEPCGARDHWWSRVGANRAEDSLTGVSYRHGGGWPEGPRETGGYVVQQGDHWVFAGTGLGTGDRVGNDTSPPLLGFECDGAPFDRIDEATGLVALARHAPGCGTPEDFLPLAAASLGDGWQDRPAREPFASKNRNRAATMGIYSRNGTAFTAGTSDWAQVLARGGDSRVERMTRNILDRLLQE